MGHRWISTDCGSQCFRCGLVLDYRTPDTDGLADGGELYTAAEQDAWSERAHSFAPPCTGPETGRAHHYVFEWDRLSCAYGDAIIRPDTDWATIGAECVGG